MPYAAVISKQNTGNPAGQKQHNYQYFRLYTPSYAYIGVSDTLSRLHRNYAWMASMEPIYHPHQSLTWRVFLFTREVWCAMYIGVCISARRLQQGTSNGEAHHKYVNEGATNPKSAGRFCSSASNTESPTQPLASHRRVARSRRHGRRPQMVPCQSAGTALPQSYS